MAGKEDDAEVEDHGTASSGLDFLLHQIVPHVAIISEQICRSGHLDPATPRPRPEPQLRGRPLLPGPLRQPELSVLIPLDNEPRASPAVPRRSNDGGGAPPPALPGHVAHDPRRRPWCAAPKCPSARLCTLRPGLGRRAVDSEVSPAAPCRTRGRPRQRTPTAVL